MPQSDLIDLHDITHGHRDDMNHDEVITRAAVIVPKSLDEENRSVNCVLTTEDPVRVYDWRSGKIVLETLVVAGCEFEDQTPLLRDHRQYDVEAILGSVTEHAAKSDELVGLVTFGDDLDDKAEAIWRRVKQGHLRRVSVGYDYTVNDYITITAGESQVIDGRTFKAPKDYDLRVVRRWRLREVSVVVIPADKRAQMRSDSGKQRGTLANDSQSSITEPTERQTTTPRNGSDTVNELLRFLRSHGLSSETTLADNAAAFAWAKSNLDKSHFKALHDLVAKHSIDGFVESDFPIPSRSTTTTPTTIPPNNDPNNGPSIEDGIRQERERQAAIRSLADEHPLVPQDVVQRCLDNGTSVADASTEFLKALRSTGADSVAPVPSGAPGGHVRGGITLQSLQAGLLARCGIEPDHVALRSPAAEGVFGKRGFELGWLRGAARSGQARDQVEAAFDAARNQQLAGGSFVRFCEALIELSGERASWNDDDILERAFSNGNFSALFGSVVHMMMVAGFAETPSTYQEFCRQKDVPDFRPNKEAYANGVGRLKKQGMNGGKAALLNIDDPTVAQVAAERYAGMLVVSDQVIINDSFDVVDTLPREIGVSARQIPGDLAWSLLLGNPNLSDGSPLFVDGTNYITDGAMTEDGLNSASTLLKNKKIGNKRIVVSESTLFHGTTLSMKAKKVITSTTSSDGTDNVMKNSYRRVEDNVIDLGCANPADEDKEIAGKPNTYFVNGEPKRSIVMAWRRGTNRGPVTRSGRLPVGEFGTAWDVLVDVGVAAATRTGIVRVDVAEV
ncbi:Clp protease [Rhodopirellula maiorica SM1]|uniref:Clp protease n=1 Tax=Rhodopirellula maiorica SM1 TaxID=1265738 RepID=M5REI8_9BACT|nr:Clp protease [Rhodopirellula maiorica]EMI17780.1 Clp protease [Rhodopirellula maiorica SM1]